ncbi:MAG: sigma-54 dependent transcriptional regulator [Cyclobacteriaceae bacterium]
MTMDNKHSVLVVDDSHDMLELVRRILNEINLNPFVSDNVVDAIEVLENGQVDLVITDLNMPEVSGMQLIRYMSQHYPKIPVLVITGYPNVADAVEVMKMGALEYLIKPFTFEELQEAAENVLGKHKPDIPENDPPMDSFHGIIGHSQPMQNLFKTIDRIKNNKVTVLISGESGTGKELVARAIHYNSNFSSAPFIPVNCGAIPEQLMESELFGHLKGAFTGASTTRVGFFQAADGGTLFLDEISNTSLNVQAKLLRAIQEKEVNMLGATKPQRVDVRIISASNADLAEMIETESFREDLYYRINVVTINIPSLRERKEDIPLLLDFFNQKFSKESAKQPLRFSKSILKVLQEYSWPGNVRELENFVQRMVIMNDIKIDLSDIPPNMKMTSPTSLKPTSMLTLEEVEKQHINRVLAASGNNKTKAAKILGIDRKTLREKVK